MKLNEVRQMRRYTESRKIPWVFHFELHLDDNFSVLDAKDVAAQVGAKSTRFVSRNFAVFQVTFPTKEQALQAKRRIRRLSRGRPTFDILRSETFLKLHH